MLGKSFWTLRFSESFSIFSTRISLIVVTWYFVDSKSEPAIAAFYLGMYYGFLIINGFLFSNFLDQSRKKTFIIIALLASLTSSVLIFSCIKEMLPKNIFPFALYLLSICSAIYSPIVNALIPSLVPNERIESAYAQSFSLYSIFNIAGVLVGAFFIDLLGVSQAQLTSIFLFGLSLLFIAGLKLDLLPIKAKSQAVSMRFVNKLNFFINCRFELWWSIFSFFANFLLVPLVLFAIPVYVSKNLGESSKWVALFEASISLGMLCMAIVFFKRLKSVMTNKLHLVVFAFALVAFGLSAMTFFQQKWIWLLSLFVIGCAIIANNTTIEAMRSVCIPEEHRGFFQTIHSTIIQMSIPAGMFLSGSIEKNWSVHVILIISSVSFFILSILLVKIPDIKLLLTTPLGELDGIYHRLYKKELSGTIS